MGVPTSTGRKRRALYIHVDAGHSDSERNAHATPASRLNGMYTDTTIKVGSIHSQSY